MDENPYQAPVENQPALRISSRRMKQISLGCLGMAMGAGMLVPLIEWLAVWIGILP
jgi:hypothetical protein